MLPTYVTVEHYQRDDYFDAVTFDDGVDPIDVSGSTFTAHIHGENGGIDIGTLAFAIDTTGAASGSIELSLAADDLMAITGPGTDREWGLIFDLYESGLWNKTLFEGRIALRTAA